MEHTPNHCTHCGQPAPAGAAFCCSGCEAAYALISGMGLESYYQRRAIDENTRPLIPEESQNLPLEHYIEPTSPSEHSLHLMVDGIHCAACVWLIETVLQKEPGVQQARLNMTTRRLSLRWNPQQTSAQKLVGKVQQLGYRLMPYNPSCLKNADKDREKELLLAMAIAGFAFGNIMLFSVSIWLGTDMGPATRNFFEWFSALIALPTVAFAGRPFFRSAIAVLKARRTNMDVPISIAIITTTALSLFETITQYGHTYFDSAVALLFFLLIGRYLDHRARTKARSVAEHLATLSISAATRKNADGSLETVAAESLQQNDTILVSRGERFAADGVVVEGSGSVDNSLISGESLPVPVQQGSAITAGALNMDAPLTVQVTATGANTALAHISQMVEQATESKNAYTRIADRVARLYAPVVHLLALCTLSGWLWYGASLHDAVLIAVAVLIITCPCALALAVPAVQVAMSSRLLRSGILMKDGAGLERLREVDTVVFDKTGSLTLGQFTLQHSTVPPEQQQLASALASHSKHPLAQALYRTQPAIAKLEQVEEIAGQGIQALYQNQPIKLGSAAFCAADNSTLPAMPTPCTALWFKQGTHKPHAFLFADCLRPGAAETITALNAMGLKVELLSGDRLAVVAAMAQQAGITTFKAETTPQQKHDHIKTLTQQGHKVLMVGDGINDAPALALAHVGVAYAHATDLARATADFIIQPTSLFSILLLVKAAKQAHRGILLNFAFSLSYNAVAIPLAVAGFITPLWAAVFMSTSSITVMLNALRLAKPQKLKAAS